MNHKGGVGKTTTAANIAAGLHKFGKRVLMIDIDPQANLSLHFNFPFDKGQRNSIHGALLSQYPLPVYSIKPFFDIVTSTLDLSTAEMDLQNEPGREYLLRELLKPFFNSYHYIIIDCPPSLGFLTLNALSTSTSVIIPVEASVFSLDGMTKLFDVLEKVKYRLNRHLTSHKILITKYDARKSIQKQITERIQSSAQVYNTIIRSNVALEEAAFNHCSIFDIDLKCYGSHDYFNLCKEILNESKTNI